MAVRVLLVDDHELMREGLRAILEKSDELEIVGDAGSGQEAVRLAVEQRADLVIMDVAMKGLNGIEATRQIKAKRPETKILALSSYSDRRYVTAILRAGASGYMLKADAHEDLLRAIRIVMSNRSYLGAEVAATVADTMRSAEPGAATVYQILGEREREVLQLLAEGLSSPEIARRLHIAPSTVDTHRRNLMRKLNLHSVAALTKYAIREGLTSLDD